MEIERKWLIQKLPNKDHFAKEERYQGYLSLIPEVRISRTISMNIFIDKLTVKGEGTLSREEIETYIPNKFFDEISEFIERTNNTKLIHKDRYLYTHGPYTIECNIVGKGTNYEFMYAEVEFKSEDDAENFVFPFPECDPVDITGYSNYKMRNYWKKYHLKED